MILSAAPSDDEDKKYFVHALASSGVASFYKWIMDKGADANMSKIDVRVKGKDGSYIGNIIPVYNFRGYRGDNPLAVGNDIMTVNDFIHGCTVLVNENMESMAKAISEAGTPRLPMSSLARVSCSDDGLRTIVSIWEDTHADVRSTGAGFHGARLANTNIIRKPHQMIGTRASPYKYYWKELGAASVLNGYLNSKNKSELQRTITTQNLRLLAASEGMSGMNSKVVMQLLATLRGNSELDVSIKNLISGVGITEAMRASTMANEQYLLPVLFTPDEMLKMGAGAGTSGAGPSA